MGIFHKLIPVINRTCNERLEVIYDGQRTYLEPNYDEVGDLKPDVQNALPERVIPYALAQTVIPGTEAALDPSSFRSKIGVPSATKKSWGDCSFLEDPTNGGELCRVSQAEIMEEFVSDPKAKIVVRGKRKPSGQDAIVNARTTPFDIRPTA